ncbi:MAG: metalloregulator ArsR/SmtB family transcription factor [Desulfobacteraceae bacterium]|nr:metalloregulator ArsR/SmtB family transcription factor [Desulfobacteraceae bacterium]
MSEEEFQALLNFFKCLANENRLKILGILADQERSVEELSVLLNLKAPTVSHHLAKLKELELVQMHVDGNTHLYHLNSKALEQMNKDRFTPRQMAALTENVSSDAWEHKIFKAFLDGEQLKAIPAGRKKREVILKWLINKFDIGVKYSEKEVNGIIAKHHPDVATLRREFIMNKMMEREDGGGLYWRVEDKSII